MCKSPLHPLLSRLPKCEHHIHLEGCLTPSLLFSLAARHNLPLPSLPIYASAAVLQAHYSSPSAFTNLQSFLDLFGLVLPFLRTEADYYELGMTYFRRAAEDGVRHTEVFFSALDNPDRGAPFEVSLAGYKKAADEARKSLNMSVVLVPCFLRIRPAEEAIHFYDNTLRKYLLDGTLGGIGLAATEVGYPPNLFRELYARAKADGVPRTAHGGEEGGPELVSATLDELDVSRVDHGRLAEEDEALMGRLAREGTLLTLCPVSNVKLQGVKSVSEMPIRKFLDRGVRFSINCDDPAYFGGWTLECYCAVQEAFGLSVAEWERICGWSIEGSWCGEERKGELREELGKVLGEWREGEAVKV